MNKGTGTQNADPEGPPDDSGSFEQRLRDAKNRHGLDPDPDSAEAAIDQSSLGLVMRVGVEMVSAVAVAVAIGWGLDSWLKTRPLFIVVFVFLGGAAGIVNVWRLVQPGSGTGNKPPG